MSLSHERVLFITGASSGIGAATARAAVAEGWRVVLGARSLDKLEALAAELGEDRAYAVSCDVTEEGSQQRMVDRAIKRFGQIDAVFANAGHGASEPGIEAGDYENWRSMVLTNVLGVAVTAKVTMTELKKRKGHFILTGSRAGRVTLSGSLYGATKWAVRGYARNLREAVKGTGVRITEIAPGAVDTPFFDDPKPDALREEDIARAVMYALNQPPGVDLGVIEISPI
ncbi:UNVERIFIED_CONTAM: hypothetical protein GTU68_038860 [Idotea baltica]|nr:hypothetical protein [Idotea baltica]